MKEQDAVGNEHGPELVAPNEERHETPVYQKPVLRRYDQIEQVKPYGPSELEAG
jgi:hypothetical protein